MKTGRLYGYAGKILRVNLSTRNIEFQDTSDYLPSGIGGRGIAAQIAWNEIKPGMTAFDDTAPLIIMTGPLTGTLAPFSGRTTVCGLAPQGYPVEWYTRSSFGGHFGPELKYAGLDGIVITGRASSPVMLIIEDARIRFESAERFQGKGIIETQKQLMEILGKYPRIFAIGPAGENLSRIAVAATETESASGQGGFGAVMGYKNLKAIVVRGTGSVPVFDPRKFKKICTAIRDEAHGSHGWPHQPKLDPELVKKYGQRFQACTQGCSVRCYDARFYRHVPSKLCPGKILSGQVDCIAGLFPGIPGTFYNWNLGFEAGFELAQMTNDLGINHWELLVGMVPWLRYLKQDGKLAHIDDLKIDLDDIHFWEKLIRKISLKQGEWGKALSQGTFRAARSMEIGLDRVDQLYPAWGYAGHWDGHGDHINRIFFPFWIVSAVQWAVDTRDPISSGHGYVQNIMGWCREHSPVHGIDWERIMEIGEKVYGTRNAVDPRSGYADKAYPAYWHGHRSVIKDSLPVDDQIFPRIFSRHTQDNFARVLDIEGPEFELSMFNACTGVDWSVRTFDYHLERVIQLERQLLIRNFNRSRENDEGIINYLKHPENLVNPYIGSRMQLDPKAFKKVMDAYYLLRGWDLQTGHLTEATRKKFKIPAVRQ